MSEQATSRTPEDQRTFYNRRLREKRSKGHSQDMIIDYAANCSVPVDELVDLTPEERAVVAVKRPEVEKRKAEEAERKRESGLEQDENGKVVPAKIDYDAVKDIPTTDDAHRTVLARMNLFVRLYDTGHTYGRNQFQIRELKRRATAHHEADPSKHFLEHFCRVGIDTKDTDWKSLYEQHREQDKKRVEALKPKTLEALFDALAKQAVATVRIEFHNDDGGGHLGGSVEEVLNAQGEAVDLKELPDEDGYLGRALLDAIENDWWEDYAREAVLGDTFRPRYAHADDGAFFQDASGTVTFNIRERKVSLSAIATVERVVEEEEDIEETWEVDTTETEAAA